MLKLPFLGQHKVQSENASVTEEYKLSAKEISTEVRQSEDLLQSLSLC